MNTRWFLMVVAVAMLEVGCNHYSYPPNHLQSATGVNAGLVASHVAPKTIGNSHVDVTGTTCAGPDYVLKVHYDHDFEKVEYISLQYQVIPGSSNASPIFTQPSGILDMNASVTSGDVTLTIPGKLVTEKDSDILLRLKLRSKTVIEHLSAQEQLHISDLCR